MRRRHLLGGIAAAALAGAATGQSMGEDRHALAAANAAAAAAQARARSLTEGARRAIDDADRARAGAAALAGDVQASEAAIAASEARLALIRRLGTMQRAELAERRRPLARLMAALETMARRPPALALAQPGSLRDLVHVRALLDTTLPVIAARTADLRGALAASDRLRRATAATATDLRGQRALLLSRRADLARFEQMARTRSSTLAESALLEQDRALGLAEKARDIGALLGALGEQSSLRERLESLPGPLLRPAMPSAVAPPMATAAVAPAAPRTPAYRLPVIGRLVSGLGEMTDGGIRTRGITIATAPQALVAAPAAGRISFASAFRSYGMVVIIDHGGSWTTSLTGLAQSLVRVGDVVVAGSPIGRTGQGRPTLTVELRRGERAVDIGRLVSRG